MVNAHKDEYDAKEVVQEAATDGITFDETKIDKKGKCHDGVILCNPTPGS